MAYDNSPISMDEFFDLCVKATTFDDAGNIDVLAYNPMSGAQRLTMWHQALDVPYYDPVHRTFTYYQEAFVDQWNRLKNYYDALGGFDKVTGWVTANQGWLAGIFSEKQVMHVGGGQWVVGDIRANAPDVLPTMKHGWIPSDKGLKTVKTAGHTISIPKGVPDTAQSWHLLEFLAANQIVGDAGWEQRGTYYPWKPWRDKMDFSGFSGDDQFRWLIDTVKPGVADKNEPYWPLDICAYIAQDAGSRENNTFEAVMIGELGVEEGLQRLEDELNTALDQAIRGG